MSQNEKVTPIRLREILRKLRMTANKALFPSVSPVREFACTKKAFPLAAMTASGRRWLIEHQNADGGWSGAAGSPSSVEETAVALEALAALEIHGGGENPQPVPDCVHPALEAGARWLAGHLNSNAPLEPAPIGFYFARLWYYERLYPLIFAVAALR